MTNAAGHQEVIGHCKDIVDRHHAITASLLENCKLLKQLKKSYKSDTDPVST